VKDRRRTRTAHRSALVDGNPLSVQTLSKKYCEGLQVKNFSESTVRNREVALDRFAAWCLDRGVQEAREVTRPIVERYQRWLFTYRRSNGKPLSFRVQYNHLATVKQFFKWLTRSNQLLHNPASELDLPRIEKRLPRVVLTAQEMEQVLIQPDVKDVLGLRDRAMLETLYSTGMRRMELSRLSVYDVDRARGTVLIREGKGKKDRVVPIGERALMWMQKYVDEVRPELVVPPDEGALFLSNRGEMLQPISLTDLVRNYVEKSGIGKKGSCHLLRHTMATLMLENGADIRFIQVMLGHSDLSSTEIYTQVSIRKLKEIHTATHPGAGIARPGGSPATETAGALQEALDAEAVEEQVST